MAVGHAGVIVATYRETLEHILRLAEELSEERLAWRPLGTSNSVSWNVWHIARMEDHLQAMLPTWSEPLRAVLGPGRELWDAEQLTQQWGLDASGLGWEATGMQMDEQLAATLRLPSRDALLDYARRAFRAAIHTVDMVSDERFSDTFGSALSGREDSVGGAITVHLVHANRHLGRVGEGSPGRVYPGIKAVVQEGVGHPFSGLRLVTRDSAPSGLVAEPTLSTRQASLNAADRWLVPSHGGFDPTLRRPGLPNAGGLLQR